MTSHLLAAAAAVGLLGAGLANAGETRSIEAMTGQSAIFAAGEGGGAAGDKCRVDVVRTGSAGSADIARQNLSDGSCVCTITTGPAGGNGAAESIVGNLLRDRECEGGSTPAEESSGGMGTDTIVGIVFGVGAIGAGVALSSDNDSAG
jgi:hypothetical protein